jgi:hypothetical protein
MEYQENLLQKSSPDITTWVPRISLVVGLAAFSFQILVLFPWHLELSEQFSELKLAVLNATRQVPR